MNNPGALLWGFLLLDIFYHGEILY
jgi:hypothetical protein